MEVLERRKRQLFWNKALLLLFIIIIWDAKYKCYLYMVQKGLSRLLGKKITSIRAIFS